HQLCPQRRRVTHNSQVLRCVLRSCIVVCERLVQVPGRLRFLTLLNLLLGFLQILRFGVGLSGEGSAECHRTNDSKPMAEGAAVRRQKSPKRLSHHHFQTRFLNPSLSFLCTALFYPEQIGLIWSD